MDWGFVVYWLAWVAVGFGVAEAVAIHRKRRGDTFSETVWWLQREGRVFGIPVVKWLLFGLFVWLFLHFFFPGTDRWMW